MVYFGFVLLTILSTVASQVLFKFGVKDLDGSGISFSSLFNFYILTGLFFSVVSIASWLIALSKLSLSIAYPFMSLTFPLVLICSVFFFNEPVSLMRWLGVILIMVGLIFIGKFS